MPHQSCYHPRNYRLIKPKITFINILIYNGLHIKSCRSNCVTLYQELNGKKDFWALRSIFYVTSIKLKYYLLTPKLVIFEFRNAEKNGKPFISPSA